MINIAYLTDFACELYAQSCKTIPNGVKIESEVENNITITKVNITKSGMHREKGRYITLDLSNLATNQSESQANAKIIAKQLASVIPKSGTVLVIGVGNKEITADKLGPKTVDKVFATRTIKQAQALHLRSVCTMVPGVEGASGIATIDAVLALTASLKPCAIICVDSLLTSKAARLGNSVQISTSGLCVNTVRELSQKTIGVPVIALGIPTMMQIKRQSVQNELVITPKNIDIIIERCAKLLSGAINMALLPSLTIQELEFIVS